MDDSAKVGNKKPQMGCIGKAQRLNPQRFTFNSPGVGAYELAAYTSLSKAKQSTYVAVSNEKTRNHRRGGAYTGRRSASNMDTLDFNHLSNNKGTSTSLGEGHKSARVSKRSKKEAVTYPTLSMYEPHNTFHSKGS